VNFQADASVNDQSSSFQKNWETFSSNVPKSATTGALSNPSTSAILDDIFGTASDEPSNQKKIRPPIPSVRPVAMKTTEEWKTDTAGDCLPATTGSVGKWNPFLT